jgi:hypothetical protein
VVALADLLADEQHRRLVTLALADDIRPRAISSIVRLDGRPVGVVLLASPHEPGGGQRRRLRHPDHLQREQ